MGKIGLNEWLLTGLRIANLSVRLWAKADRQLRGRKDPLSNIQLITFGIRRWTLVHVSKRHSAAHLMRVYIALVS